MSKKGKLNKSDNKSTDYYRVDAHMKFKIYFFEIS